MTEPEVVESEDTSYLKVNIRKIGPAQIKTAQRFRRQFRQDLPERWTDPAGKIEFIFRVVFATGGMDALTRTMEEFATLVPAKFRERAEMNALVYTRRFAELSERTEALWAEAPSDLDR
ncbi:MAG: hypothetical protein AAFP78_02000, partial [Pseudomonadota bacterium]